MIEKKTVLAWRVLSEPALLPHPSLFPHSPNLLAPLRVSVRTKLKRRNAPKGLICFIPVLLVEYLLQEQFSLSALVLHIISGKYKYRELVRPR